MKSEISEAVKGNFDIKNTQLFGFELTSKNVTEESKDILKMASTPLERTIIYQT